MHRSPPMLGTLCKTQMRLLLRNRSILWIAALLPLLLHPVLAWGLGQLAWLRSQEPRAPENPRILLADERVAPAASGRVLRVRSGSSEAALRASRELAARLRASTHGDSRPAPTSEGGVAKLRIQEFRGNSERRHLAREMASTAVLLLLLLAMSWPALELTIGERSRGLTETLASAPITAGARTLAKILCTSLLGVLVLLAHGTGVSFAMLGSGAELSWYSVTPSGLALAAAAALSFVLLSGTTFLYIGARSREFGEAHAWSWLVFVLVAASLLPLVLRTEVPWALACLPGPGHALCLDAGLAAGSVHAGVIVCLAVSTALTYLLVRLLRRRLASFETETAQ